MCSCISFHACISQIYNMKFYPTQFWIWLFVQNKHSEEGFYSGKQFVCSVEIKTQRQINIMQWQILVNDADLICACICYLAIWKSNLHLKPKYVRDKSIYYLRNPTTHLHVFTQESLDGFVDFSSWVKKYKKLLLWDIFHWTTCFSFYVDPTS